MRRVAGYILFGGRLAEYTSTWDTAHVRLYQYVRRILSPCYNDSETVFIPLAIIFSSIVAKSLSTCTSIFNMSDKEGKSCDIIELNLQL